MTTVLIAAEEAQSAKTGSMFEKSFCYSCTIEFQVTAVLDLEFLAPCFTG